MRASLFVNVINYQIFNLTIGGSAIIGTVSTMAKLDAATDGLKEARSPYTVGASQIGVTIAGL